MELTLGTEVEEQVLVYTFKISKFLFYVSGFHHRFRKAREAQANTLTRGCDSAGQMIDTC